MRPQRPIYRVGIYCQSYDIVNKTNTDGKWSYAVQINSHFSINIVLIKAIFAASNHGVRVYYTKSARKRIMRKGISGFLRDVDEICVLLQWRTEGGDLGCSNPPSEIQKALQNRAKLNPTEKTVKNC